jgi:integrase
MSRACRTSLSAFGTRCRFGCGIVKEGGGKARYGFHAIRHAAASLFIAHLEWTPKRVQSVLGHASITMTFDRYGHLFEDREGDQEALKKLEAAIVAA